MSLPTALFCSALLCSTHFSKSKSSEADRPLQSFPKFFSTITFSSSGYSSPCQGHYCLYNRSALQLEQKDKCFRISGYQTANISVNSASSASSEDEPHLIHSGWYSFDISLVILGFVPLLLAFHKGGEYKKTNPRFSFFTQRTVSQWH